MRDGGSSSGNVCRGLLREDKDFELGVGNWGGSSRWRKEKAVSGWRNSPLWLAVLMLPSLNWPYSLPFSWNLFFVSALALGCSSPGESWGTPELREQNHIPREGGAAKGGGEAAVFFQKSSKDDCIRRSVSFLQESKWKKRKQNIFLSLMSAHPTPPSWAKWLIMVLLTIFLPDIQISLKMRLFLVTCDSYHCSMIILWIIIKNSSHYLVQYTAYLSPFLLLFLSHLPLESKSKDLSLALFTQGGPFRKMLRFMSHILFPAWLI